MPGCEGNIADIITAVEDGSLPIGYLQRCCAKLLEVDLKCASFEGVGPYSKDQKLKAFVTVEG